MAYLNKENCLKILASSKCDTIYIVKKDGVFLAADLLEKGQKAVAKIPNIKPGMFGSEEFKNDYHVKYALCGGAMANSIASTKMVIELGKHGFIGSFGAGGCSNSVIEKAIDEIQKELKAGNFMINMLATRNSIKEMELAELLIRKNVTAVEASAYIRISEALIYYRVNGLKRKKDGTVFIPHKIMAKISREEVLRLFLTPPDERIVNRLLETGRISIDEALLAKEIPMADDITVEADSGGHTDGRPLVSMLPSMIALSNRLQNQYNYKRKVRIGAGGGIGTGLSALGAFLMGASYVVTGSINQSCVEAGTSSYVKEILKDVEMADVVMAPCADMFEIGGRVQVIKKGTMYAQNAQRLYEYYLKYTSLDEIPDKEKEKIQKRIVKRNFEDIWENTKEYFKKIDPSKIKDAEENGKKKMALIFRWYLGSSSRWAVNGDLEHKMDMQIWCGQSLGAFNQWVKGTYLELAKDRKVAEVSYQILKGAAYSYIINLLRMYQVDTSSYSNFTIEKGNI
ncbi:PfaD family polyunsaturated fatty acid/polyketide biosynthesis protein [Clostridium felsineum]|uniref:PfaD family polyunsaturated fatty acid/polyketide biosynthesis protein n=1 Tax=Clostridium felsineum TaxID=36839 RepID=UPI00214DDE80|nr:PfaD family polyunsaturated fatty acid/polyketide biosynthesis protein [Clostridium felsineum]MCR3757619.1 PfaD family polyunsaturated fatty acid/polyketide biosynthesis protein [Clostridium felsineum]